MKKKIYLFICMTVCLFALSACSGKKDTVPSEEEISIRTSVTSMLEACGEYSDEDLALYAQQMAGNGYEAIGQMFASLLQARAQAGSFVAVNDDWDISFREDGVDIAVTSQFTERDVKLNMTYEGERDLQIGFAKFTPVFTKGELLLRGAANSLFGIATVALVLLLMVGIISCFRFIPMIEAKVAENKQKRALKKSQKEDPQDKALVPDKAPEEREVLELELVDDFELVAVITAAIAAMEDVPADGLVVRSIRRSPKNKWNRA